MSSKHDFLDDFPPSNPSPNVSINNDSLISHEIDSSVIAIDISCEPVNDCNLGDTLLVDKSLIYSNSNEIEYVDQNGNVHDTIRLEPEFNTFEIKDMQNDSFIQNDLKPTEKPTESKNYFIIIKKKLKIV